MAFGDCQKISCVQKFAVSFSASESSGITAPNKAFSETANV